MYVVFAWQASAAQSAKPDGIHNHVVETEDAQNGQEQNQCKTRRTLSKRLPAPLAEGKT